MRQNIKAKETYYDGYRFRSRLEARWAVFFNNIGLEYEYEMEGFDMEECSYLPDFYIPSIDRWFEIKGQPLTVSEIQKCEQFCRRKDNENIKFSILIGAPKPLMLEEENFSSALTESRSQTGPRRLGTATRISASLSRRLSAFFESTSRPRPKSGKVCRFKPRPRRVSETCGTLRG